MVGSKVRSLDEGPICWSETLPLTDAFEAALQLLCANGSDMDRQDLAAEGLGIYLGVLSYRSESLAKTALSRAQDFWHRSGLGVYFVAWPGTSEGDHDLPDAPKDQERLRRFLLERGWRQHFEEIEFESGYKTDLWFPPLTSCRKCTNFIACGARGTVLH